MKPVPACVTCTHFEPIDPENTKQGVGYCMYDRSVLIPGSTPVSWANRVVKHGHRCKDFEAIIEANATRRKPSQRN